jgi:hypothetical protein
MRPHLGSVVWCLSGIAWLGSTFFGAFTLLVVKCTTSAECKTNRLAVLMVKSGLDPHMIIELEDGLKSLLCLPYAYGVPYPLCLMWDGIYLYLLVNSCLIKFDKPKC